MGILDRTRPISELGKYQLRVIYSNPKVGKTTTAARLGDKNVFLCDEEGPQVLKQYPELEANSTFVRYEGMNDLPNLIREIRSGNLECDNLVVDTMSGIVRQKIQANMRDPNIKIKRNHPEIPALQDYQLAENQWTPIIRGLPGCGVDITVLCHLRLPDRDDKGNILPGETVRPELPRGIYQALNRYACMIVLLKKDGVGNRSVLVDGDNRTDAGSHIAFASKNAQKEVSVPEFVETVRKSKTL